MKIQPSTLAADVAVLDGRELFLALPVREGGFATFCRACGHETRLVGGMADARGIHHTADCRVGKLLSESTKPVWLRVSRLVAPN